MKFRRQKRAFVKLTTGERGPPLSAVLTISLLVTKIVYPGLSPQLFADSTQKSLTKHWTWLHNQCSLVIRGFIFGTTLWGRKPANNEGNLYLHQSISVVTNITRLPIHWGLGIKISNKIWIRTVNHQVYFLFKVATSYDFNRERVCCICDYHFCSLKPW